jgi:antitoxin component of MazEF toxin-antitoxin module
MRLQKHFSRKVGNKEYSKYVVVIPNGHIEQLEWKEGQELESEVKGKKLLLSPKEKDED